MKMSIGSITLAAVVSAGVGIAAQTPVPPQTATPAPPPRTEAAAKMTITGCIEPFAQSPTASARASDTKFVLINAKSGKSESKDPAAPVGTSGSSSGLPTASTYRLEGSDAALTPEVGHQVEIVAVVVNQDSAAPGSGAPSEAAQAPTLRVETVKMIAAACPQQH